MNSVSYLMTKNEFLFLCTLCGAKEIIGIVDYEEIALLPELDIQIKWDAIKISLKEKHYINEERSGIIKIDQSLGFLINICCKSDTIWLINISDKNDSLQSKIYFLKGFAVEVEDSLLAKNGLILTPYNNAEMVSSKLQTRFRLYKHEDAFNQIELKIKPDVFEKISDIFYLYDSLRVIEVLTELVVSTIDRENLMKLLMSYERIISLVLLINSDEDVIQMQKLFVICTDEYTVMFDNNLEENYIHISNASDEIIQNRIDDIMWECM